jgi:hypothetical protein
MIGLFASFMASVGLGGDASAQFERQHKSRIEVARLQTVKFEPGDEYLQRTLNLLANLRFLKETRFRKPVYVVTGVKVAYGGRTSRSNAKALGGEGSIGLNPAFPGLQLGPKAGLSQKIEESEDVGEAVDFVYAFRLNKVHYSRRKERFVQEKFTKGAVFSQEAALDEDIPLQLEKAEIDDDESGVELLGLEEECSGQDEFGLNGHDALDESGEACILVAPYTQLILNQSAHLERHLYNWLFYLGQSPSSRKQATA